MAKSLLLVLAILLIGSLLPGNVLALDIPSLLPTAFQGPEEWKEQTPWGEAIRANYSALDSARAISYQFSTFKIPKAPSPRGLQKVRGYFLRQKKCVARTLQPTPILDRRGQAWPQAVLGGVCAADLGFRTLILIAHGNLYQLTVSLNSVVLPTQNGNKDTPTESRPLGTDSLDQFLRHFAGQCQFDKEGSAIRSENGALLIFISNLL